MKSKILLISLGLSIASANAAAAKHEKSVKPTAEIAAPAPNVSDAQVNAMQEVMARIVQADNVSGPEELFKIINGQTQTVTRELAVQGAVTEATAKGMRIVCYQEGDETVVASSDPTLLGKPVSDFKTDEGKIIRDEAIEQIRNGKTGSATFTYREQTKDGDQLVNGKPVAHSRVVVAYGRKAFTKFQSDKKFLCTVGEVTQAQ